MTPNDLSAAARALSEFELLQREVMTLKDEARQLRELLSEKQNMVELGRAENEQLHRQLADERVRTNRWIIMSTKLTSNMAMIEGLVASLKTTAIEVAQTVAERGLEDNMSPEDLEELKRLAGTPATVVPLNTLNGDST